MYSIEEKRNFFNNLLHSEQRFEKWPFPHAPCPSSEKDLKSNGGAFFSSKNNTFDLICQKDAPLQSSCSSYPHQEYENIAMMKRDTELL